MRQRQLWDDGPVGVEEASRQWRRLPPPEGYRRQWESLRRAAIREGVTPSGLDGESLATSGLGVVAQRRGWSPATVALYAKVARYAGVQVPRVATPEPSPPSSGVAALWSVDCGGGLEVLRAVAWLRVAAAAPAPLPWWASARLDEVRSDGDDVVVDGVRAVGAGWLWSRWVTARQAEGGALAQAPWALVTLRAGPASPRGSETSVRALEAAFARHCRRVATEIPQAGSALEGLTYDGFRRATLRSQAVRARVRGEVRARQGR